MNDDLRHSLERLLRDDIAPALGFDPQGLDVVAVENGIASVRLGGVCASCGASVPTVVAMLEAELKERMPEIEIIEAVS